MKDKEVPIEDAKTEWVTPEIKKFGSFEAATQRCIKDFGSQDGFTWQGNVVPIHWCAS
jgi:hypothetical protein